MGSKQSSEQNSKKNALLIPYEGKNTEYNNIEIGGKNHSSYNGVKSDFGLSSEKGEQTTKDSTYFQNGSNTKNKLNQSQTKISNQVESKAKDLVEVTFIWKEKGNDVFITGSFAGWKQWFMLEKQGDIFYRKLQLPKEKHYFKFIVDKDWKCSDNYNKEVDYTGNVNNSVDLTYVESPKTKETQRNGESSLKNIQKLKAITKNKLKSNNNGSYNEIYPERSGLNTETPIIPSGYINNFDINNFSIQYKIGNPTYINLSYNEIYCNSNNSTSEISLPPHINM